MIPAPPLVLFLGGWRATAFAFGLIFSAAGWGIQSWRLDSAHTERDLARQTAATCVASNATNLQTIHDLQQANGHWADQLAADQKQAAQAVAAVAQERDALRAELDKRRAQRDQVYAHDANAAAWGRAVVPSAVVAGLRE